MLFRVFLLVGFVLIAVIFMYYTQHVVGQLKNNASRMVDLSIKLLQVELSNESSGMATGVIFDEIIAPTDIPIIITDSDSHPLFFRNLSGVGSDEVTDQNLNKLRQMIADMFEKNGRFPIKHIDPESKTETIINYFYYGDPKLISQLRAMPLVEIGIVAVFLIVAYIGYRNIKRSEQHFIWVGMAKETAHQLGTPISSLMGWLELIKYKYPEFLKSLSDDSSEMKDVPEKMDNDLDRLQKIANRFSQIGSRPALKSANFNLVVSETVQYFRDRLPYQGKGITIETKLADNPNVQINSELMSWVIENLIKNSLESCDPRSGKIKVETKISADNKYVVAEVNDNGKGVQPQDCKKIFHPGFTSKQRGWGLGLSLAKRIVEEYHNGKIGLKLSDPDRETILRICLPIEKDIN